MNRRDALFALVALAVAPACLGAQQDRLYRIGVVLPGGPYYRAIDGLQDGLKELGLEEGKHYVLHIRDTRGDLKSVEAAARALEREKVDLIYSLPTSVTLAVKEAAKQVPIVFYVGANPVTVGLVESYRKPGGRLTGIHGQFTDVTGKRLQILKELVPRLRRVVAFYNPGNRVAMQSAKLAREAAARLKTGLVERPVASIEELRAGVSALRPGEVDGLLYVADAMVTTQQTLMIKTLAAKKIPGVFQGKDAAVEGALATLGVSYYTIGHLSAKQVQRVLLGANPGDLPVELVDRSPLVVNLKTAKVLGITVPESVLAQADEIIR